MRPLHRSLPVIVALGLVVALVGAIGFVPLFDGPGYEIALASGLIVPFAVAIAAALDQSKGSPLAPIDALARGLAVGAGFALAAWLTTIAHGLRVGFCDAGGGTLHFALGPLAGSLLAGAWGAAAAEVARGRKRRRLVAVLVAIAAPIVSIAISIGRFITSPMIFAYDPFVGFFSGSIYDTVIDASGLVTYRAGSLATLIAAGAFALHLRRDDEGRLRLARPERLLVTIAGVIALAASVGANAWGHRLGHWQTSKTIADALGARIAGKRCDVIYPSGTRREEMELFTADCDAHVATIERWFGAEGPPRITAFVFDSAAQKGALMGAADTYIAKPWRREVYVQASAYPHRVLGHELVHVIAGSFARGPFHVAGSFGALLPNPGLIEGVAVAAEPPHGDLSPRAWAKSMKDLKILPPLDRLFALGFLAHNAGVGYTVSGAFVGWVHDRFGGAAVRAWYGGRALPEVTGKSWPDMERAWHEELDTIQLPEAARGQAKARFDRPAIFGRRCPHVVDACKVRGDRARGAGDHGAAIAAFGDVLALDPHDDGTRVSIAMERIRGGDLDAGARALREIAESKGAAGHVRDRAKELLADLALASGRSAEAARAYRDRATRVLDEDHLRTLDVKIEAAEDEKLRPGVVALLIGPPDRGPDRSTAMELLGGLVASAPGEGLPWYLLGRQHVNAGRYDEGAARLDRALAGSIRSPRVRMEAERLRMVSACALGDRAGALRFYALYAGHRDLPSERRGAARALVERCTGSPIAAARE
jgi:tetratricopeptide (TPR) repeat protein